MADGAVLKAKFRSVGVPRTGKRASPRSTATSQPNPSSRGRQDNDAAVSISAPAGAPPGRDGRATAAPASARAAKSSVETGK